MRGRIGLSGILMATFCVVVVGYLVWLASGQGSEEQRIAISDIAFLPAGIVAAALAFAASRKPSLNASTRRAWTILGFAFLTYWAGDALWAWYELVVGEVPWPSLADAAYLLFFPVLLAGLLSFPSGTRSGVDRLKVLLDATIVVAAGAMAVWYLVLGPTAAAFDSDLATSVLSAAYPVGDLLMLFGIALVALGLSDQRTRRPIGLLVGGLLAVLGADLLYGYQAIQGTYLTAGLPDGGYMVAWLLLSAAAYVQIRDADAPELARASAVAAPSFSLLPYLAVAGAFGLLLWAPRDVGGPIDGLIYGAIFLTGLVVARQILVIRENARLTVELGRREARFRSLVQNSSDVVTVVAVDGTIAYQSASVGRMLGHPEGALVGTRLDELAHPDDRDRVVALLASTAGGGAGTSPPVETRWQHSAGTWVTVESIGTNLLDDPGVSGIVLNSRDVSERKVLEQQLTHLAFHDPLTGLANRALFQDRLEHTLARAQRHASSVWVLFLDLDDFKRVNDSLGHAAGDELLVAAAERLRTGLRPSDTIARFGGDEFAILLEDLPAGEVAKEVAERLGSSLSAPYVVAGRAVTIGASIGVASTRESATDSGELLRNADVAMYLAKSRGKGRVEVFEPQMQAAVFANLELEAEMRLAMERGQFSIDYQPIVQLADRRIAGVEALVRWQHPTRGRLAADQFVQLAESTGIIVRLGRWVLGEACRQAAEWRRRRLLPAPLTMNINVSARQLVEPGFVDEVREVLAETGVDPRVLVLELTETAIVGEPAELRPAIDALKGLGLRLAIDDFGTGYASIGYLRELPIDVVKIDGGFVGAVPGSSDHTLLEGIVQFSRTLELVTVAEGVELETHVPELERLGCDLAQGFWFAPPLQAAEIEPMLAAGSTDVPAGARAARRPKLRTAQA